MDRQRDAKPAMMVPELNARPRHGYARGAQGVEQILRTSERLLIAEGLEAVTIGRVAEQCGMLRSNLTYYFKSRSDLVRALVDAIAASYQAAADTISLGDGSPEQRLRRLVDIYLDNIATERTTRIFTELWPLASRDPEMAENLQTIYGKAIQLFAGIVGEIRPGLCAEARRTLATFMVAWLEGQTVFVGHRMPYRAARVQLRRTACDSFVELTQLYDPDREHGKT